ncbi:drosulfakinins-like [Uloborus diversus]|uniref:drosulfakinins-like n=1 Tax=Uloborus diversus TaxID=327109 RepID=UPI0024097EEF|nr:drosulfakinins-like [Uloborus diversus]
MNCLWTAIFVLMTFQLTTAGPPGPLQRLARLVMPYVGGPGGRHSLALARSLDTSSLARRHGGEAEVPDVGLTDFDDEESENVIGKRQFDDYGHMRFGRSTKPEAREKKFDDYGHMRYGK